MRKLSLIAGLALAAQAWGADYVTQRARSVTIPDENGRPATFPVISAPSMNNVAKADLDTGRIYVNWNRLMSFAPATQTVHLVLAHEAGHLLHQDLSPQREERADYFAGRTMRMEGYTSRDMAVVRYDMLRMLGRGDSTHPPAGERVRITMQGYNSVAGGTAPVTNTGPSVARSNSPLPPTPRVIRPPSSPPVASNPQGEWRRFGRGLR